MLDTTDHASQAKYRLWAQSEVSLPLWHQPWWLDATAGSSAWDAAIVPSDGTVAAALPYVRKTVRGFDLLLQPPLTQSLGPWFSLGRAEKLSDQHALLIDLHQKLPQAAAYSQQWMPEIDNWLPFYWEGYHQTTRYSYRLDLTRSIENLWESLDGRCRTAVRKCTKLKGFSIELSSDLDAFWPLFEAVYERQGARTPVSRETLCQVYASAEVRSASSLLIARDGSGFPLAGALLVNDASRVYYLAGGVSEQGRALGAMNALLWHSIELAHEKGFHVFDFEGSMTKSIESFFRSFGASQSPYFHVWKYNHPALRLSAGLLGASQIKKLVRKWVH